MMTINTIRYYPNHIQNIEEYRRIAKAYDKELRLLWLALGKQLDNLDLSQADAATCDRWAKLLGITFMPDEIIEDKRRLIRGKMTSGLPYTEPKIKEILNSMIGEQNYVWDLDRTGKTLRIGVMLAEVTNVDAIAETIRAVAPADVDVNVYIYFNRWKRFLTETWATVWNHGADTWHDVKANAKWQEV